MTRIFYLGCHKLLIETELIALRRMGFEIYRPTYLSDIYDQSAFLSKDEGVSTLPPDVKSMLDSTNFFYQDIDIAVGEMLEEHFDAVIVTISPAWLKTILKVYKKTIIYRTFGQPYNLTYELNKINVGLDIVCRDNFWYMPHSEKALEDEDSWLLKKSKVVPYWIDESIFEMEDTWRSRGDMTKIGYLCPNIDNGYYAGHYKYLKSNFDQMDDIYYGVQPRISKDPRIRGTIERSLLLKEFSNLAGFNYTYGEKNTCYLAPIECAIIGVPVLYRSGSLLDKYLDKSTVGRWSEEKEAHRYVKFLKNHDQGFINEIKVSQKELGNLYRKSKILNSFETAFFQILEVETQKTNMNSDPTGRNILILFDALEHTVYKKNMYYATQGIPRVTQKFAQAMVSHGFDVTVTSTANNWGNVWGFMNQNLITGIVNVAVVERELKFYLGLGFMRRNFKLHPSITYSTLQKIKFYMPRALRIYLRKFTVQSQPEKFKNLEKLSNTKNFKIVFIPHYQLFTHFASSLKNSVTILYMPDLITELYPKKFKKGNRKFEKILSDQSSILLTNSHNTAKYLPTSYLKIDEKKIRVIPIPFLNTLSEDLTPIPELVSVSYICYPTAVRPNKAIDLLINAFDIISQEFEELKLVLTGDINSNGSAVRAYKKCKNKSKILFYPGLTDSELAWLYKNSKSLVLTSYSEGNFPPQISEAISQKTPVIASDIPVVKEKLSEAFNLILFVTNDLSSLVEKIRYVLRNQNELRDISWPTQNSLLQSNDQIFFDAFGRLLCEAEAITVK